MFSLKITVAKKRSISTATVIFNSGCDFFFTHFGARLRNALESFAFNEHNNLFRNFCGSHISRIKDKIIFAEIQIINPILFFVPLPFHSLPLLNIFNGFLERWIFLNNPLIIIDSFCSYFNVRR